MRQIEYLENCMVIHIDKETPPRVKVAFSTHEAAESLGKTPTSIRKMIQKKELKAVKIGKSWHIPYMEVKAKLWGSCTPSAPPIKSGFYDSNVNNFNDLDGVTDGD